MLLIISCQEITLNKLLINLMSCIKSYNSICFILWQGDQKSWIKGLMWLQVQVPCWNMVLQVTVLSCIGGISPAWILPAASLAPEDQWSGLISVRFGSMSFEFTTFHTCKNRNLCVPKSCAPKSEGVLEEPLFRPCAAWHVVLTHYNWMKGVTMLSASAGRWQTLWRCPSMDQSKLFKQQSSLDECKQCFSSIGARYGLFCVSTVASVPF